MNNIRKILLITGASNYERHKNVIKSINNTLKEMGGYILYVLTSYGIYTEESLYNNGESSIYELLDKIKPDGCILEGNIGNEVMCEKFAQKLQNRKIPFITLNFGMEGVPVVSFDSYGACSRLMEHLIEVHQCTKINLVTGSPKEVLGSRILKAYKDMLKKYDIPFDEKRVFHKIVSIENGKELYYDFKKANALDAEAVICAHDVYAIGLYLELEQQGITVPEDMLLCALNYSANSMAFRPDITGVDRMDNEVAKKACELLDKMLKGEDVPFENYFDGKLNYGQSCGCLELVLGKNDRQYRDIVLMKIETGKQIRGMMEYNDTVEAAVSVEELGKSIHHMMKGVNCNEFICCLNTSALEYIVGEQENNRININEHFDREMVALTGNTIRTGEIVSRKFDIDELIPIEQEEGDIIIFLPIHYNNHVFGYMAFVNELLPVNSYNYRICHESLGNGIENLHRKMLLQRTIKELDTLHLSDQLTGLYNRFALERFKHNYISKGAYTVVMLDMDNLKGINDKFGHLSGNLAICTMAEVIKSSVSEADLVIRYGGDEFLILSQNTDENYWEAMKGSMNDTLAKYVQKQKLPYNMGVSIGYAICKDKNDCTLNNYYEMADKAMYADKKERKRRNVEC